MDAMVSMLNILTVTKRTFVQTLLTVTENTFVKRFEITNDFLENEKRSNS